MLEHNVAGRRHTMTDTAENGTELAQLRAEIAELEQEIVRLGQNQSEYEPRSRLAFVQNFEQVRNLNTQMNAVPTLAMVMTGGLWFGAGLTQNLDAQIRFALLVFAGIVNVCLALICIRIRDVLQSYLEKAVTFFPPAASSGMPRDPVLKGLSGYSMISIYSLLMLTAAALSWFGAFAYYWPFPEHTRAWGAFPVVTFLALLASVVFSSRSK